MNATREVFRRTSPRIIWVGLLAAVALVSAPTWAAGVEGRPAYRDHAVAGLDGVRFHRTVLPDLVDLAAEDRDREQAGEPFRFAVPEPVALTLQNDGTWEALFGGRDLWRLRIDCPGAVSLNLGFGRYFLTPGAELLIYAADGTGPVLRFDDDDVKPHGELWTPILVNDAIVVELTVPSVDRAKVLLEISSIGRGYRHFPLTDVEKAGSCNIDVVCPEGDPWRDEIDCVGVYSTGGSTICTGAMINNTSEDGRPYFLTAYHCGINAGNAASMVVYWNFQSPTCGQQGGGPTDQFQTGATLRAFSATSDFKLLELDDEPDASYGVKYAGWDRSSVDPSLAVAIHHPNTDEKSISFENDPLTTTTYLQSASPGNGTHLRIADWDLGTTEPGSSGSPLFNPAHRIVGQLHGGYAACGNDESDWYGRLSVSWDGDGTAATRLSDWLDPGGTGALTTDLYDPSWVGPQPGDHANLQIGAAKPNPFTAPMLLAYTVDRDSDVAARIFDIRGCLVRDLGVQTASFGDNNLFWNGRDGGGRTVPAGLYIVEMTAEGVTQRTRVVFLH